MLRNNDNPITNLYQENWWKQLQLHNKQSYKERILKNVTPWFILTPQVIQLIFLISEILHQPPEVRYLTIEIFDRFLTCQYLQLYAYVWNKPGASIENSQRQWDRVVDRVKHQLILRALTCMQLASKLVNTSEILTPVAIMNFLKHANQDFTEQSIISSERRVFETIQFKIPFSHPLTYVEFLIQQLSDPQIDIDLDSLYSTSIKVLDVAYIQHHEIYLKLFHLITGRWERTPRERQEFLAVECDNIYLACAVIVCAADISEANSKNVIIKLHQRTGIPLNDLQGLSSIITELIVSE
ncbi:cyclin N-terminal domain-containing protein 1-like isoform X2 [Zootermopsis nevadensis]|uniref:cyclin N-terminal domain-containing protein 1-like isoform X2 n=1 Tax=Zootermopsis nevadensis TaxID=136037 RepID=UPI000B8ECB4D|nr:cyclin N-terminal domain-containing protein 1-like isoform X2 [Zootermopsis nevadensis]